MRPLVLREIADELGLHESTISRVTTAKYMATPFGTFELKYFFGSGLGTETGGNASSTAVRALIKQFVAAERPEEAAVGQPALRHAQGAGHPMRAAHRGQVPRGAEDRAGQSAKSTVNQLQLFLPCAAGVEELLADEVHHLTGLQGPGPADTPRRRAGARVLARRDALNLHGRLAQRVLVQLSLTAPTAASTISTTGRQRRGLGDLVHPAQTFKIDVTAQHSPLTSLNFAALQDQGRGGRPLPKLAGVRPDVTPSGPTCASMLHLTTDTPRCTSTPRASRCSSAAGARTRATRR
jgi:hypothetical protein